MTSVWERKGSCNDCGYCCNTLTRADLSFPMGPRIDREFYRVRGFGFVQAANRQELAMLPRVPVVFPCPSYDQEGKRCTIYENRPRTCREFPTRPEDILGSPCSYWFDRETKDGSLEVMGGDGSPHPGHKVLEAAYAAEAGGQP